MRILKNSLLWVLILAVTMLSACGSYSAVQKAQDYEYKYEVAKAYMADGHYGRANMLLGDVLAVLKGTHYGEECLYLLALTSFKGKDYESATQYFRKYYQSYPKGAYVEQARFYCGYALYKRMPDVRLDQTGTMEAITEFQNFLDYYPDTKLKGKTQDVIMDMQDRLVEKEYLAAKLYYNLGTYMVNCAYGGSNYEACVVTAENALKDYPYAYPSRKEELGILIVRAKYGLALQSVDEKSRQRYIDAIDECYAFQNEFPESKYTAETKDLLRSAERMVKLKKIDLTEPEE